MSDTLLDRAAKPAANWELPWSAEVIAELADAVADTFGFDVFVHDIQGRLLQQSGAGLLPAISGDEFTEQVARNTPRFYQDRRTQVFRLVVPLHLRRKLCGYVVSGFFPAEALDGPAIGQLAESRGVASDPSFAADLDRNCRYRGNAAANLLRATNQFVRSHLLNLQQEDELEELSVQLLDSYEELSLLHALGARFNSSSPPEYVLTNTCRELQKALGRQRTIACMTLIRASNDGPESVKIHGEGPIALSERQFRALLDRYRGHDLPWGQPFIDNEFADPEGTVGLPGTVRLLLVPLCYQSEMLGLLVALADDQTAPFNSRDAKLLANLATQTAGHWKNFLLFDELRTLLYSLIRVLVSAIDAKDPYTCGHSERVGFVARKLAQRHGIDREAVREIYLSGLLHDIGKIGIRESVLSKPGALTAAEWEHLRQHPDIGARILEPVSAMAKVIPGVRFHHEAINGNGYPLGLKGEEIPLMARVIAIADSYDAMSTDRPYRRALTADDIQRMFKNGSGVQWDKDLVASFFELLADDEFVKEYHRLRLSTSWRRGPA